MQSGSVHWSSGDHWRKAEARLRPHPRPPTATSTAWHHFIDVSRGHATRHATTTHLSLARPSSRPRRRPANGSHCVWWGSTTLEMCSIWADAIRSRDTALCRADWPDTRAGPVAQRVYATRTRPRRRGW